MILSANEAERHCRILMAELKKHRRIDFETPKALSDPGLSTDPLFSASRGQMLGLLLCSSAVENEEKPVILKAFSGQFNGIWKVRGWAPPLLDPAVFRQAVNLADPPIKHLTAEIDSLPADNQKLAELIDKRRLLSQAHMREIHGMYQIRNFIGGSTDLFTIFENRPGIPAGTGDCCAPKLLNQAILLGLKPLSLAEFFWGRENRSGTKKHGQFYPPCTEKCGPLLNYMLQGAEPA